jgi:hypothetical protein
LEGTRKKRIVIGFFPAHLTKGYKFLEAHIRFYDGEVFHCMLDVLVYSGDEFSISGEKLIREKVEEFWIV